MRISTFVFICIFVVITVLTSFIMASAEMPPLPYDSEVSEYMIICDTVSAEPGDNYKYYVYGTTFPLIAKNHDIEPEQILLVKNENMDLFPFKAWNLENGQWVYAGQYSAEWLSGSMDIQIVSNTYDIVFMGSGNIFKMATTPVPTPQPTEEPTENMMDKPLNEYSVVEGLLLIIMIVALVTLTTKIFRG